MSEAQGIILAPLATAAALDASTFAKINADDVVIPVNWEDRAKKAWEYYIEEPLVKNCINSWRTFAVGDEIRISSDDDTVKTEANELADRLGISEFVKDMILQLLAKGDAVGFKRYTKDGKDFEEVTCVNPISVKVKYAQGQLVEVQQFPEDSPTAGDGLKLPVEQTLHLKWDAPSFSPRGNSLVLPAFESIELLRDYRRAEKAMGIETAQEMLGLDPAKNPTGSQAMAWTGPFAHGDHSDQVCDSCAYFDAEHNRCGVTQEEVAADSPACRFMQAKKVEST